MKPLLSFALPALIVAMADFVLAQGPLTPPPGAPAPTMRTLDEVEPRINLQRTINPLPTDASYHYIINAPGSYYLSANLGVTKVNGIQINTEGVTLDLNGFEISRASGTGGNGIEIPATSHRACIRNGSLKGFAYGINSPFLSPGYARACEFLNLGVSNCTFAGIYTGEASVLESCRAHGNSGSYGIFAGEGSSLANCTATNNSTTYGIRADAGSSLTNCTASNNTARYGIFTDNGCSLSNCSASANTSNSTTSAGIGVFAGSTVSHCTSYANVSTAATLTFSTGMGFDLASSCTIRNCSASFNAGDGINLFADSTARDNNCDSNGAGDDGAGIHATSSDNRIEGNNVSDNNRGIKVDIAGNLIIKNSASGNTTNYDFVANNVFGAIVDRTAPASAIVSGNNAVSSAGTTDPWANFSY